MLRHDRGLFDIRVPITKLNTSGVVCVSSIVAVKVGNVPAFEAPSDLVPAKLAQVSACLVERQRLVARTVAVKATGS